MSEIQAATTPQEFTVNLKLERTGVNLIKWLTGSILLVYAITSLDALTSSSTIHTFVANLLYWTCGDSSIFQGQIWRLITDLWLHTSLWHIANNLLCLLLFWNWVSRYYSTKAWFGTYMAAGIISSLVFLTFIPTGHPDFSQWQGLLAGYFSQEHTPLAGASGAIFGLAGMAFAIAVRLSLIKKYQNKPVVNIMGAGPLAFTIMFAFQVGYDNMMPGVAGLAHDIGMLVGFIAGMLMPMKIGTYIIASRAGLCSMHADITGTQVTKVKLVPHSSFNAESDWLTVTHCYIDYRLDWHSSEKIVLVGNGNNEAPQPVLLACNAGLALSDGRITTNVDLLIADKPGVPSPVNG
jgi:membrane associated rhomboid family serine protease